MRLPTRIGAPTAARSPGASCRFVMLIDSPVFTRVRLQLLSPERYPDLMRAMYSLLMLCPQSRAFHTLHARLSSVPTLALLKLNDNAYHTNASCNTQALTSPLDGTSPVASSPHEFDVPPSPESSGEVQLPWAEMLQVQPRATGMYAHRCQQAERLWFLLVLCTFRKAALAGLTEFARVDGPLCALPLMRLVDCQSLCVIGLVGSYLQLQVGRRWMCCCVSCGISPWRCLHVACCQTYFSAASYCWSSWGTTCTAASEASEPHLQMFKSKQEKLITYHEDRDRPPRMAPGGQGASGVLPAAIPVNAAAWETASSSSFAGTPGTKRLQSQNALSSSSPGP